nr:MAG TPA: hypothetical protein [Bacteriophage sp.]
MTRDTYGFRGLNGECKAGSIPVPRATRPLGWGRENREHKGENK